MTQQAPGDMPLDELREEGHRLVDWIADYLAAARERPVLSEVEPGAIRSGLPGAPPEDGVAFADVLADFERHLVPGLTQWGHPSFFAYFPCGFSIPGTLADFLSTAVSQQAMLWRTSPAATELEAVTLDWLRQAMGLPEGYSGVIYDTASTGIVHALAAARHRAVPEARAAGLVAAEAPRLRVYCSEHAHSSVDKAVITLGLGHEALRRVPADREHRLRPEALAEALAEDREAGWRPLAVVATVGTTSSTAVDPVPAVADLCAQHGLWLHVDAAYAGAAALLPEARWAMAGTERADSLVVNAHKWLFTPFDCSILYTRHLELLKATFSLTPEYLRAEEGVENLMDTGFQLGRRFRALKLWSVLRYFGLEGLRERLREHLRLARLFASWVDAEPGFERVAPVPFSVVCFRIVPQGLAAAPARLDDLNERLMHALNATGRLFLSHTRLDGRLVLRLAIGNLATTEQDVAEAWKLIREEAGRAAESDGAAVLR